MNRLEELETQVKIMHQTIADLRDQRDRFRRVLGNVWILLNDYHSLRDLVREAFDEKPV